MCWSGQLSLLLAVISPISKLQDANQPYAILYLDEEFIRISLKTNSESGITCFAELSQKELFVEHRIESAADNVIVCRVDLVSLKLALQSVVGGGGGGGGSSSTNKHQNQQRNNGNNAALNNLLLQQQEVVILKLAKRNRLPCLCLEGRHAQSDHANHDVEIHQAIPVTILRKAEMQNHLPPQINIPQVQLELPMDRPIRPLLDKLKAMGQHGKYNIMTIRQYNNMIILQR